MELDKDQALDELPGVNYSFFVLLIHLTLTSSSGEEMQAIWSVLVSAHQEMYFGSPGTTIQRGHSWSSGELW